MTAIKAYVLGRMRTDGLALAWAGLALVFGLVAHTSATAASGPVDAPGPDWVDAVEADTAFTNGVTRVVTNCNNSGSGSLRTVVANANSGDTIDLSGLSCTQIGLQGPLVIKVKSLRIDGRLNAQGNLPAITIKSVPLNGGTGRRYRTILHTFNGGSLWLRKLTIQDGYGYHSVAVEGGCVYSEGSVHLVDTAVRNCQLELGSGSISDSVDGILQGGGVYAWDDISLSNSAVYSNKITQTGTGNHPRVFASGGGIFTSAGSVSVKNSKVVYNEISTENRGYAEGGGIYAWGSLYMDGDSTVSNNSVSAKRSPVTGGGIYCRGDLDIWGSTVSSNKVEDVYSNWGSVGGGIYAGGDVTLFGAVISYNSVRGDKAQGAGIFVAGDSTFVFASTIKSNQSDMNYGGLYQGQGETVIQYTTINNNSTINQAGGLYAGGNVEIDSSTISGNKAGKTAGAALGGPNSTRAISIEHSTISGNKSSKSLFGAGLYLRHDTTIQNSTITDNTERNSSNNRYGAGITLGTGVTLDLSSTIVSGNRILRTLSNPTYLFSDIGIATGQSNASLQGDHNLLGTIVNSTLQRTSQSVASNYPGLGTLQDNGGSIKTHMPQSGSLGIDKGIANGHSTDQRGTGYSRIAGIAADIGSVESNDNDLIFADGFELE